MVRAIDKDKLITSMAWHDQQGMISYIDDVLDIIEAFPTLNPPNAPLTPEQLRDMDGKPIWIEHDEDPQYNHVWMIWNNEIGFRHDLAGYNIFWRAYRYSPEEDT